MISLQGVKTGSTASVTTLCGQQEERNSIDQPALIVPIESTISVADQFSYRLPASSFQVIRIPKTGSTSVLAPFKSTKDVNDNQITAVPNPADQYIQVSINAKQNGPYTLSLIDYKGRSVYHQSAFNENMLTIPRNNLPAGLYILQLVASGKAYQTKISFN